MSLATLQVRIAFASNPLDTPLWTDVTAAVRTVQIRRGRQDALDRYEAGVATVVLDNRDRQYEPAYAGSTYYPNIVPMRRISIRATWNSVTYDLYTGYVEEWQCSWPYDGDSFVTLACVDGFRYFGNAVFSATVAQQLSGNQIKGAGGILSYLSWPAADQSVNAGISTLQAWTATNGNALERMQAITESEQGYLWMHEDGKIYFRERHHRLLATNSLTSQGTFGDGAGELPYVELVSSFDDTFLYNDIHATRVGGTEQTATDATSQAAYFERTLTKSGLLVTTDSEASDLAQWILARSKDPALRFTRLVINPQADDSNLWPHVLNRKFHERITVKRRPPGGGAAISQDCFIEGIEHDIDVGLALTWTTSWNLSPASSTQYWRLDDAILSVLDTSTRLVY